ncbi:MAG: hypothetical protein ACOCRK_00675 [bacterium]
MNIQYQSQIPYFPKVPKIKTTVIQKHIEISPLYADQYEKAIENYVDKHFPKYIKDMLIIRKKRIFEPIQLYIRDFDGMLIYSISVEVEYIKLIPGTVLTNCKITDIDNQLILFETTKNTIIDDKNINLVLHPYRLNYIGLNDFMKEYKPGDYVSLYIVNADYISDTFSTVVIPFIFYYNQSLSSLELISSNIPEILLERNEKWQSELKEFKVSKEIEDIITQYCDPRPLKYTGKITKKIEQPKIDGDLTIYLGIPSNPLWKNFKNIAVYMSCFFQNVYVKLDDSYGVSSAVIIIECKNLFREWSIKPKSWENFIVKAPALYMNYETLSNMERYISKTRKRILDYAKSLNYEKMNTKYYKKIIKNNYKTNDS